MAENTITKPQRISVVDSLRGFAVVGIIIIHFLEHMNFYNFPTPTPFEQHLWDVVFFLGSSKMYAIFALLFGLSCFIQHSNQEKRGYDFRPRFAWRMFLLFMWGMLDLVFFNGDVLCTYAVLGLFLIPLVKASDKVLALVAFIFLFQPIEIVYIVLGLINPELQPMDLGLDKFWAPPYAASAGGSFFDVAAANLSCGLQINFGWAIEHGRLTQTFLLFVTGMILGRKRFFLDEGDNRSLWKKVLGIAVLGFCSTQLLLNTVSFNEMNPAVGPAVKLLLTSWRNLSMTAFYVVGITMLYYCTGLRSAIDHLACIGKMSLTDYILQSVVGGFLFFNWGLSLYKVSSHGISFLLGIAFCIVLYFFCRYWTSHFKRGPLEELWARATWLGKK